MDCILTRITIGQRACRSPKGGSSFSGFDLFPRLSMDKLQELHGSPGAAHLEPRRLTPPQRIGKTPKLQIPPCNVLPVFQGPTFGSCSTLAGAEPRHRPFLDRTQPLRHTSSAELSPVSTHRRIGSTGPHLRTEACLPPRLPPTNSLSRVQLSLPPQASDRYIGLRAGSCLFADAFGICQSGSVLRRSLDGAI